MRCLLWSVRQPRLLRLWDLEPTVAVLPVGVASGASLAEQRDLLVLPALRLKRRQG